MPVKFLGAASPYPMCFPDGRVNYGLVHLNRVIDHPNIEIGDYTYASSFEPPEDWAARLAPYTYPGAPERLVIGRFGQIADGVRIITASANHPMAGVSTYPFAIFDHERVGDYIGQISDLPDTIIGHDVWLGDGAVILPGTRIGDGVIVGARAVVSGEIPDYAIVAGNPARIVRMRFDPPDIRRLQELAWWNWPASRIDAATSALAAADIGALAELAP
ncbi:CatB-related O-acetyltransferase [Paracoccus alkanivorans]|uniref:Antibiotic acetyltransferase n=1 Tax=Paracoccus alkanivorans TaxID=2116655 RepID=A0A3M0MNU6_9RHOB|nr:CatB-related O-acetyltransferase [Paracoccus alkanivorans]RMC37380.1 antibiotic acetyltransferase [Paracoccus alkanivorans]